MTYEEIVKQFIESGEHVHIIQDRGLDIAVLHVFPVALFTAMKSPGHLYVYLGNFDGEQNRLVESEILLFEDISPEFINERVRNALAEPLSHTVETHAMHDPFPVLEKERRSDRITFPPSRGRGLDH